MEVAGETASQEHGVAGQLIKSVADTTDKLAIYKKVKDIEADNPKAQNTVTNNALVGSTSELSKMLKDRLLNNNGSE